MRKIYIVTPGDVHTGGPEVSHQLAHELNKHHERAHMLYLPLGKPYDTPPLYRRYNVKPAHITALEDIPHNSIIVIPESAAPIVTWWPKSDIYYWWLSVDGAATAAQLRNHTTEEELQLIKKHTTKHLYASEYAHNHLHRNGIQGHRLYDPQRNEYQHALTQPTNNTKRRNLIVYQPKKGGQTRTQPILNQLDTQAIPITGMHPNQIHQLLLEAKICIDLCDHPGKDRLPREAAASGTCIITNRRGAAAGIDIPIPDWYKIDDHTPGYEHAAAAKIRNIITNFEHHQPQFDNYRTTIAADSALWPEDVAAIFGD